MECHALTSAPANGILYGLMDRQRYASAQEAVTICHGEQRRWEKGILLATTA